MSASPKSTAKSQNGSKTSQPIMFFLPAGSVAFVATILLLGTCGASAARVSYYSAPDIGDPVTDSARSAAPFGVPANELDKYIAAAAAAASSSTSGIVAANLKEDDEDTEGVVIEAKASTKAKVASTTTEAYVEEMQEVEQQSIAQAQPDAIALAGPGGVASSAPRATALVGKAGLAISSPRATAVAGTKDMIKKQADTLGLKRKLSPARY